MHGKKCGMRYVRDDGLFFLPQIGDFLYLLKYFDYLPQYPFLSTELCPNTCPHYFVFTPISMNP